MARLIRIDRPGPYKIEPKDFPTDGKSIWICGCGLSSNMPYCDKSHKACAQERPGTLYLYDPVTKAVIDERPAPPPSPPPSPPPPPSPLEPHPPNPAGDRSPITRRRTRLPRHHPPSPPSRGPGPEK